jgi:hypothetical protein
MRDFSVAAGLGLSGPAPERRHGVFTLGFGARKRRANIAILLKRPGLTPISPAKPRLLECGFGVHSLTPPASLRSWQRRQASQVLTLSGCGRGSARHWQSIENIDASLAFACAMALCKAMSGEQS